MNNFATASTWSHMGKSGQSFGLSEKFSVVKILAKKKINYFGQDKEDLAKLFADTYIPWLSMHLRDNHQGPFSLIPLKSHKIRRMHAKLERPRG